MLAIRLSRQWRKNLSVYRVVLTEHTKPVKFWYKAVLWSYDPVKHVLTVDVDSIVSWIKKGAKVSERLAKLLYKDTHNEVFKKFIVHRERNRTPKKEEKK